PVGDHTHRWLDRPGRQDYAPASGTAGTLSGPTRPPAHATEWRQRAAPGMTCVSGLYLAASASSGPRVRRLINQRLFKKLYIAQDGSVERFELTEPFVTLLDCDLLVELEVERATLASPVERSLRPKAQLPCSAGNPIHPPA